MFQPSFWNPNLPATLKGLVGGTRGWGSNVFFAYKEVFCSFEQMMLSLFVKSRLNECKQKKISPLSLDGWGILIWWIYIYMIYMIAVVCHKKSQRMSEHLIFIFDIVGVSSLCASVLINSFEKTGPPRAMSHPNKPKKKTHSHLPPMQTENTTRWYFQSCFIFTSYLGKIPHVD